MNSISQANGREAEGRLKQINHVLMVNKIGEWYGQSITVSPVQTRCEQKEKTRLQSSERPGRGEGENHHQPKAQWYRYQHMSSDICFQENGHSLNS
jgi:hypothetical protein